MKVKSHRHLGVLGSPKMIFPSRAMLLLFVFVQPRKRHVDIEPTSVSKRGRFETMFDRVFL